MTDDSDFLEELQDGFLEEAKELLTHFESSFLDLEKDPGNLKIIEDIFRLAHNVKGSAAAVGFSALSAFAHKFENLLVALKDKKISANAGVVDTLLACNDILTTYIDTLTSDKAGSVETGAIEDLIDITLGGGGNPAPVAVAVSDPEEVEEDDHPEELEIAKAHNTVKNLGEILVEDRFVTEEQLEEAVTLQNSRIGEILVKKGDLQEDELNKALQKQREQPGAQKKPEEFIRLPLSKIDSLLDCFGEQVILQSSLEHYRSDVVENVENIQRVVGQLGKITHDLQQTAISLRMLSLKSLFSKMQRIVRDTSKALGKEIDFQIEGEDTELDKQIVDELSSPLTHLIRNAVDHGVEDEAGRLAADKPRIGHVSMKASYRGRYFCLEITDDGKGLDQEAIKRKAIAKGLLREGEEVSAEKALSFIFMSGFSTKEEATDISGRGVGMDAIKQSIEKLKGSIELESEKGKGTKVTIKLPPTLALFNGMTVALEDGGKYVIPNADIVDLQRLDARELHWVNKDESLLNLGKRVVSVLDVLRLIKKKTKDLDGLLDRKNSILLITERKGQFFGLVVSDILYQGKVVFKNLGKEISGLPGVAGGTILSDGGVSLILDIGELIDLHLGDAR